MPSAPSRSSEACTFRGEGYAAIDGAIAAAASKVQIRCSERGAGAHGYDSLEYGIPSDCWENHGDNESKRVEFVQLLSKLKKKNEHLDRISLTSSLSQSRFVISAIPVPNRARHLSRSP
jgi:hypothetical protein